MGGQGGGWGGRGGGGGGSPSINRKSLICVNITSSIFSYTIYCSFKYTNINMISVNMSISTITLFTLTTSIIKCGSLTYRLSN